VKLPLPPLRPSPPPEPLEPGLAPAPLMSAPRLTPLSRLVMLSAAARSVGSDKRCSPRHRMPLNQNTSV